MMFDHNTLGVILSFLDLPALYAMLRVSHRYLKLTGHSDAWYRHASKYEFDADEIQRMYALIRQKHPAKNQYGLPYQQFVVTWYVYSLRQMSLYDLFRNRFQQFPVDKTLRKTAESLLYLKSFMSPETMKRIYLHMSKNTLYLCIDVQLKYIAKSGTIKKYIPDNVCCVIGKHNIKSAPNYVSLAERVDTSPSILKSMAEAIFNDH